MSGGPFWVRLGNFNLTYGEEGHKLTIPVELLLGESADYSIGTALIRRWDSPSRALSREEVAIIRRNILAALEFLEARITNLP